jgi:hypothetical protein
MTNRGALAIGINGLDDRALCSRGLSHRIGGAGTGQTPVLPSMREQTSHQLVQRWFACL